MNKENLKTSLRLWVQNEILVMIKEVIANQDSTDVKAAADIHLNAIVHKLTEGIKNE